MSVNKVLILGNVASDIEPQTTQSGIAMVTFRIATNSRFRDKEETEFHRIVAFGKTAELASQHLSKGDTAFVEGSLRTNKYKDKAGVERTQTSIIADSIQFLGKRWQKRKEEALAQEDDIPF